MYQTPFEVKAKELTKNRPTVRQESILRWIVEYIVDNEVSPAVREIGRAFNIRSTNGIVDHLRALERKGWIKRGEKRSIRTLRLTEKTKIKYNLDHTKDKNVLIGKLYTLTGGFPYNCDFENCETAMDGATMMKDKIIEILEEFRSGKPKEQ